MSTSLDVSILAVLFRLIPVFGLILAIPLVTQTLPMASSAPWVFLPLIGVGSVVWLEKCLKRQCRPDVVVVLLFLLVVSYLQGIVLTEGTVSLSVWKDFIRGCYLLILAGVVIHVLDGFKRGHNLLKWFSATAATVAIVAALLGTIKYRLLLDQFHVSVIAGQQPGLYPWGTSLMNDSNFFSLSLLVGGLSLLKYWWEADAPGAALLWGGMVGLVFVVGAYAGSRRFWVMAPPMVMAFLGLQLFGARRSGYRPRWGMLLAGVALAIAGAVFAFSERASIRVNSQHQEAAKLQEHLAGGPVAPPTPNDAATPAKSGAASRRETAAEGHVNAAAGSTVKVGVESTTKVGAESAVKTGAERVLDRLTPALTPTADSVAGLDYSYRLKSLINARGEFGGAARFDRWRYAFELSDLKTALVGDGFVYRHLYACRFLDCHGDDYPHNPILSALLYGGLFAMFVAVAITSYTVYCAVAVLRAGQWTEVGLGMLSVISFTMISGDTFFSMPICLAMLIATRVAMRSQPEHATPDFNALAHPQPG